MGGNNFLATVKHIYDYHPYRREGKRNPDFNRKTDGVILNLKDGDESAINFFTREIVKIFPPQYNYPDVVICCAPSSDKEKLESGIRSLSNQVALTKGFVNGTNFLVRTTTIEKLAHGGSRSYKKQRDSLGLSSNANVKGKVVFLLDDIITSGSTLRACRDVLIEHGASEVHCFVIGKTTG